MKQELTYEVLAIDLKTSGLFEQELSEEESRWYLKSQQDPMIGAQTGSCTFTRNDSGWEMKSKFPLEFSFPHSPGNLEMDWNAAGLTEAQTHALWKYSIGYLPALLDVSHNFDLINAIVDSLWEYTLSSEWKSMSAWMTSLDHCIAVRTRTLCSLYVSYSLHNIEVPKSLFKLLANDILNMCGNGNDYFPTNNHGAMAAISLLHAAGILPNFTKLVCNDPSTNLVTNSAAKLNSIITDVFDDYGIPSENSPEYHLYWVSLLKPVSSLFQKLPALAEVSNQSLDITSLQSLLNKVEQSLQFFRDSSGKLIPIGDSYPIMLEEENNAEGVLITEENGFSIYREEDTVLTVNCGSVNYAHKHCDDTSITLSYRGENFLLDAGYYSHDWNDPKAIFTKSQSAHSGLFLTALDNVHPGKLYWPGQERIKSSMSQIPGAKFHVRCSVSIDSCVKLQREIKVEDSTQIEMIDKVEGNFSSYGTPVRRFVLPLDADLHVEREYIEVHKNGLLMEIHFSDSAVPTTLVSGQEFPEFKGWVAYTPNTLFPARTLEIPVVRFPESITRIRFRTFGS